MPDAPSVSPTHPVVAELVRDGFVEGRHRGSVVWVDADGSVRRALGEVDVPFLPRSASKPVQALAMLREGVDLDGELLAVACASHSAESIHLAAVRDILQRAGLDERLLQNPVGWPLEDSVRDALSAAGGGPSRLHMNCSGKHAAMLATCVVNGWDLDTYLDPAHPLQAAIRTTLEELTGVPVEVATTDGCGAPLFSTTLVGLARAFGRLARAESGPERRVASAIRSHPALVSGTGRDEAALLAAIPGAIGKAGAEAVYAVALPDGAAVALKIDDGSPRARPVVMAAALAEFGYTDPAVLATGEHRVTGGSAYVGDLRPVLAER